MNLSEPISLDLEPRKWVYRLWAGNVDCHVAERQQIHDLGALYNDGGWRRLHPSPETAAATQDVDDQLDARTPTAEQLKHRLALADGTLEQLQQLQQRLAVAEQTIKTLTERVDVMERAWRVAMKKLGVSAIDLEDIQ